MVTNNSSNIPTAASRKVLMGQGVGTSSDFSTATYPATTTSQQILYSTATNAVGELTTANSKFPATNSSGTLAMRAISLVIQTFTSNGTYTPTPGMFYCEIQVLGGGGAGGGSTAAGGGQYAAGSAGGSAEYAFGIFSAATIGASQTITIGNGGVGVLGDSGGTGGNTSVGSLISANGGSGGIVGTAAGNGGNSGGNGGTGGTGGNYRTPGTVGLYSNWNNSIGAIFAGIGASSQLGSGGQHAITFSSNGSPGLGYGAGGGGSVSSAGTGGAAFTGGNGSAGVVIVKEYVIS